MSCDWTGSSLWNQTEPTSLIFHTSFNNMQLQSDSTADLYLILSPVPHIVTCTPYCHLYPILSPVPHTVTCTTYCHLYPILSPVPHIVTCTPYCHLYPILSPVPHIVTCTPYCHLYPILSPVPHIVTCTPYCHLYPILSLVPHIVTCTPYCHLYPILSLTFPVKITLSLETRNNISQLWQQKYSHAQFATWNTTQTYTHLFNKHTVATLQYGDASSETQWVQQISAHSQRICYTNTTFYLQHTGQVKHKIQHSAAKTCIRYR